MITKENLIKYLERKFLEPYEQGLSEVKRNLELNNYKEYIDFKYDYNLREQLTASRDTICELIDNIEKGKLDNYTDEFKG